MQLQGAPLNVILKLNGNSAFQQLFHIHGHIMLNSATHCLSNECDMTMVCSGHRLTTIHVHGLHISWMACTEQWIHVFVSHNLKRKTIRDGRP
jgi:hypothetical protein